MSKHRIRLTIPSITSQIDCSIVGSYDFSITHQIRRPTKQTKRIYHPNKMFVLNSQFTNVHTHSVLSHTIIFSLTIQRLMLHAIHLHSHWAIIIGSVEANKVWFDVSSGFCLKRSICLLFTLQWYVSLSFSGFGFRRRSNVFHRGDKLPKKKKKSWHQNHRCRWTFFDQIRTNTPKIDSQPPSFHCLTSCHCLWKVKTYKS